MEISIVAHDNLKWEIVFCVLENYSAWFRIAVWFLNVCFTNVKVEVSHQLQILQHVPVGWWLLRNLVYDDLLFRMYLLNILYSGSSVTSKLNGKLNQSQRLRKEFLKFVLSNLFFWWVPVKTSENKMAEISRKFVLNRNPTPNPKFSSLLLQLC